jgi:alpha-tubulin suppressor-like RCC1 family protein
MRNGHVVPACEYALATTSCNSQVTAYARMLQCTVCATVTCFGANGYGQLGVGDTRERGSNSTNSMIGETVNIGAGYTAKAISCGGNHVCVHRLPDNSLLCFGSNVYGQLGLDLYSTTHIGDNEVCRCHCFQHKGDTS